jgi:pilus assembly protein FimV
LDAHDDFGGFQNTKEEAVHELPADDFSFDLDAAEPAQPSWEQAAPQRLGSGPESSDMMLDLDADADLPTGDELGMGEIDEIATKLDLARAYIEMHETDGAREILQEVVAEGNAAQKKEAETLLSRL